MPSVVSPVRAVRPVQGEAVEAAVVTAALGIACVLAFAAVIVALVLRDMDDWARHEVKDQDIFGDTRRAIRALPETAQPPYDWALEDAA